MTLDELRRYCQGARVGHKPGETVRVHLNVEDLDRLIDLVDAVVYAVNEPDMIDPDPQVPSYTSPGLKRVLACLDALIPPRPKLSLVSDGAT